MSDNPQAYPCLDSSGHGLSMRDPGMTLRDYFAGQALSALLTGNKWDSAELAVEAYRAADAMLSERSKETSGE